MQASFVREIGPTKLSQKIQPVSSVVGLILWTKVAPMPATAFCREFKIKYWRAIPIQLPFIAAELPKARISPLMKSTLLHSTEYYDIRQPFLVKILDESIV